LDLNQVDARLTHLLARRISWTNKYFFAIESFGIGLARISNKIRMITLNSNLMHHQEIIEEKSPLKSNAFTADSKF
jgi:hypothetical protein